MIVNTLKDEVVMWRDSFLRVIPGRLGCYIRNALLPYTIGFNSYIWESVIIEAPKGLKIGNNTSINRRCIMHAGGGIEISDDVLIGPNTTIYSQNHNYLDLSTPINSQGYTKKSVYISRNVWIAAGCIILPGVSIGENSIVAAGSVVTKTVPDNCVVAGVPASIIKYIL